MQAALMPVAEAVAKAEALVGEGTVILTDAADATSSGATGNGATILAELLAQIYSGAALAPGPPGRPAQALRLQRGPTGQPQPAAAWPATIARSGAASNSGGAVAYVGADVAYNVYTTHQETNGDRTKTFRKGVETLTFQALASLALPPPHEELKNFENIKLKKMNKK